MQTGGRVIRIAGILIVGILVISTVVRSQAPTANIWEYASVSGIPPSHNSAWPAGVQSGAHATICYATLQGCRFEEITDPNEDADAPMIAAAKLGTQGWEFTSATEIQTESVHERVMYFRRLKSK